MYSSGDGNRSPKGHLKHRDPTFWCYGPRQKGDARNHGFCRLLVFMWSLGPLGIAALLGALAEHEAPKLPSQPHD